MPGAWGTGINKTGRNTATMVPNEMTSCQWTYAQGAAKGCMWKRWGLSENATLRTWTWRTSISYGQRIGIRAFQEESWVWGWTLCLHRCTQVTGAWHRWTVRKCGGGGASHVAQLVKNLPAMQETWVRPLGWEDPWRRERLPSPVFWPGEFHGLCSPWGGKESDRTERLSLSRK